MSSRYQGHPTNSAWQCARATLIRGWIFEVLGRTCQQCGATEGAMEVNHLYKREWSVSRLSMYKRTLRYWKDVQRGLCNCLCAACNSNWRGYKPMSEAPPLDHVDAAYMAWMERNPPAKPTPPATCNPF